MMGKDASHVLKALGKSEAIELLKTLEESEDGLGFNQVKNELGTDSKTLTRRLDELGELGMTEKRDDSKYHITSLGSRVLELALEIEGEVNNFRSNNLVQ